MQFNNKRIFLGIACILLVFFAGIYMYLHGLWVTGPFIFGDESTYFSFARSIFKGESLQPYTQYGPLYPAVIAPWFLLKNLVHTYEAIRIFNIIIFLLTLIPAYFLAQIVFTKTWLKGLLPFCLIFTPFSGFIYLVWAEPLYINLFYWVCLLFFLYVKQPNVLKSILLAVLLASLYYTKPAIGLVIQLAVLFSLIVYVYEGIPSSRKKIALLSAGVMLLCVICDLPLLIHYLHLQVSIVGYPSATTDFHKQIAQTGYLVLLFKMFKSVFYQFSYVIINSFGLFGVMLAILFHQWRSLNVAERYFTLFVVLSVFGLMALCAVGVSSYTVLDYKLPNGRYFTALFPLILVLCLHLIFKVKKHVVVWSMAIAVTAVIAFIATPLYVRSPMAFNSMPDLSLIIYVADHARVVWRPLIEEPSFWLRLCVPLFFGLFALMVVLLRYKKNGLLLASLSVAALMMLGTWAEQRYIIKIGISPLNDIYIYFLNHSISPSEIVFDKEMEERSNVSFLTPFWFNQPSEYHRLDQPFSDIKFHYFVSINNTLKMQKVYSIDQYVIYKIKR